MKKTFECNNSMVITIPIRNLRDGGGHLVQENFTCVFKDFYKVFVHRGKPKHVGAVQALIGVFICALGALGKVQMATVLPCIVFVITGLISFASGRTSYMVVAKLSFFLNIFSFFGSFWPIIGIITQFFRYPLRHPEIIKDAIYILMLVLLVLENLFALFLTYWTSKAVCRQEFNTLPVIILKPEK
uniref:Uncharacterized protein n=1 Tax=Cynoglossus semilaevis TaxID=244447 RepID=A0A3P8UUJ3_CYNSE